MRLMADSTNPYDIPAGQFPLVAGYVDGLYAWDAAGWKYHDASLHVRITAIVGTYDADVADVENGDYSAAAGGQWLAEHVANNEWRVLYFSLSRFAEIHAAVLAFGVQDNQWGIWQADWDGVRIVPAGSIAKQFADGVMLGTHYDLSAVADYWPGIDALPPQPAQGMAAGAVQGWAGLAGKVDSDLPAFSSELGVLASGLTGLG